MTFKIANLAGWFLRLAQVNSNQDILDALEHLRVSADIPNDFPLKPGMFDISYQESFDLNETHDDLDSWAEWELGELLPMSATSRQEALNDFRGKWWGDRAQEWLRQGFPPIVVIKAGNFHEIADGRGRSTVALGMGQEHLPAIILELKQPSEYPQPEMIEELLDMINSVYT